MDKQTIFNSLKQTFSKKYGVDDATLQGLAASLLATGLVTDENLATVVQGQEEVLRALQVGIDKGNTEKSNLTKKIEELTQNQKAGESKKTEIDDKKDEGKEEQLTSAKVKALFDEALKPYSEKVAALEQQKVTETRNADIAAKAKEYGIPDAFVGKLNIAGDANLDDYFKSLKQDFTNIGFEGVKPPEGSRGMPTEEKGIAETIRNGTKEIVEQQTKK
ncbi:MAG: hypothetical protein LKK08_06295 [Bacteroidales bacterium]|jgi:hypothetical protein|nr:hypothetical protein [Bacteroidales bacterium]